MLHILKSCGCMCLEEKSMKKTLDSAEPIPSVRIHLCDEIWMKPFLHVYYHKYMDAGSFICKYVKSVAKKKVHAVWLNE